VPVIETTTSRLLYDLEVTYRRRFNLVATERECRRAWAAPGARRAELAAQLGQAYWTLAQSLRASPLREARSELPEVLRSGAEILRGLRGTAEETDRTRKLLALFEDELRRVSGAPAGGAARGD
jgi:hypothetical protein